MLKGLCLATLALCTACGGDDHDSNDSKAGDTGPCVAPSGFYEQVSVVKSGTCGPQSDVVVDTSKSGPLTGMVPKGCNGSASVSPDGCKFQVHATCPIEPTNAERAQLTLYGGDPPTLTVTASTTFDRTADHASGVWELSHTSPIDPSCAGTYAVTFTRL